MTRPHTVPVRLRAEYMRLQPYRQGQDPLPGGFKLSSNENPFPPLPSVHTAVQEADQYNRYPDGATRDIRYALAQHYSLPESHVLLGAGSVALLYQIVAVAAGPGDDYLFSWRSFEAYPLLGSASGARAMTVANRADHGHDLPSLAAAITDKTRVVLLCSPNNPTGSVISRAEFVQWMSVVPEDCLVVLDEAYHEFVTDPEAVNGADHLADYPNLLVLRTFSKAYGLAGLRIGYALGNPEVLAAVHAAAAPLAVTDMAQQGAYASLLPVAQEELLARVAVINARRDQLTDALRGLGLNVPSSQGNFVWLPIGEAADLAARYCAQAGAVVRPFAGEGIRISVGEEESIAHIVSVIRAWVLPLDLPEQALLPVPKVPVLEPEYFEDEQLTQDESESRR